MKKLMVILLLGVSYTVSATEYGKVIDSQAIYQTSTSYVANRKCWTERVQVQKEQSMTKPILGAIIGGVIGNQFGGGTGNTLLTAGGALLGGSVGNDNRTGSWRDVERCTNVQVPITNTYVSGYRIKYSYNGKIYNGSSSNKYLKGSLIKLNVTVSIQQ